MNLFIYISTSPSTSLSIYYLHRYLLYISIYVLQYQTVHPSSFIVFYHPSSPHSFVYIYTFLSNLLSIFYLYRYIIYLYLHIPASHFTLPPSPSLIIHHLLTVALRGRVSDAAGARRRLLRRNLLPGGAARPLQEAGRVCQILRE